MPPSPFGNIFYMMGLHESLYSQFEGVSILILGIIIIILTIFSMKDCPEILN